MPRVYSSGFPSLHQRWHPLVNYVIQVQHTVFSLTTRPYCAPLSQNRVFISPFAAMCTFNPLNTSPAPTHTRPCTELTMLLEIVAGHEVLGARMVMVPAGTFHPACAMADGKILTWGHGSHGQLGHCDLEDRLMQEQISRDSELFGGQLALMIACHCGNAHTIVLTVGGLWTCGTGQYGLLGHGDETDKIVLTQVVVERFEGNVQIVMFVAIGMHSVAVGSEGGVWTGWGCRVYLGHSDVQHRHVPRLLPGKAFSGDKVVMVAAGGCHTVTVTSKGELLAWGNNMNGQLGIAGLEQLNINPARVGFVGSLVRMMVGGNKHTLVVTGEEALWTCGGGENIMLSLNDINHQRVPTRVEA